MGLKFYRKNKFDLSNLLPTVVITDSVATDTGEDFANFMRNRNNTSGWMTTGSSDAGTTTLVIDFIDSITLDRILLIKHNLKAFTLKYWNGAAWVDFSTAISETTNTAGSNEFIFDSTVTQKLQLIITGTQTADDEKLITQFIATETIGDFAEEMELKPQFDRQRRTTRYLSGKSFVSKAVGSWNFNIKKSAVADANDLALVETLFDSYEGFLFWPSGGTVTQYEQIRKGYRLEDIFLMQCSNELGTEYVGSRYYSGMPIDLKLVEVN